MTKRLKNSILTVLILLSAFAFTLFGVIAFSSPKTVSAVTENEIFNFDTKSFIEKGRAAESDRSTATFKSENGMLHILNASDWLATTAEGFYFTYSGGFLADHDVVLGNYEYFKIRMKRVNCANNWMLLYLWPEGENNFLSSFYIGEEFDGKWVDLTISLRTPTVYVKDLSSGIEKQINLKDSDVRNLYPTGAITKLRFYFSKTVNVEREAYAEFFGFFTDKAAADAYDGNAAEKLERAENYLKTNDLNTEFALNENTEDKLLKLVSYFIEENKNINVMAEIFNYARYAYPTETEKGFIYFDVNLYSGGKVAYVENVKLTIDTVPKEPIMYKFDNEELIEKLHGMPVEKYLYNGVMKVIQPDYHQADGFWLYFDTTEESGEKDAFLMQSYPVLQWRIMYKGQGPNQFFFDNYNSLYLFGIGYDEEVWLTVQFDTSKSAKALKVLNESTGEISYYDAPNPSSYSTDYDPPAFRGLSNVFRFNMGRRSDLERWALVDYFAFFPTLRQADAYGFDGRIGVISDGDDNGDILFFTDSEIPDNVTANENTLLVSDGGLKLSLLPDKTGDTGFVSSNLTKQDAVNLSKKNVLRLGLKDSFSGDVIFTANTANGSQDFEISFADENYKVFVLPEGLGGLESFGVKVKDGKTLTLLYLSFAETRSDAENFDYGYESDLVFNTNNVNLVNQEAAYCYSLSDAYGVALNLVESVAGSSDLSKRAKPEGVKVSLETVDYQTPTKNDEGEYKFKVVLSVGDVFGIKTYSETLTLKINKIRLYEDSDDFGSRSAVTDFAFGGEGYAKTEKAVKNSDVKTVQFAVQSSIAQSAYIIGNSEFSVESDTDGEITVKVNGVNKFTSSWLELFSGKSEVITIVFGEQRSYVYENGLSIGSFGGVSFGDDYSDIFVAGNLNAESDNFKGYIKEVRIFDKEKDGDYISRYVFDTLYFNDVSQENGAIDGLIGYWRIKESNGGFTNRADYTNGLNYISENFYNGYYHEFTGEDWLVSDLNAAETLKTVETWIMEDVKDTDNSVIMRNGSFVFGIDENGFAYITDGESSATTSVNVKDGNYHHLAFTLNGSSVKYYLDGRFISDYNVSLNSALSGKYYFGSNLAYNAYNSRYEPVDALKGRIANFKVFSTVRTENEIKDDMNELYKEMTISGLALNLPFDISKDLKFTDSVKGNNVTINTINRYKIINEDVSDYITFIAIPDPQDYIVASTDRNNGRWDSYDAWRFYNMNLTINNWIIDNKEKENIKIVITLGDLTQNATPLEFNVFAEHMSVLDGLLPYTLVLGNHDYQSMLGFGSSTRGADPFNAAFPYDKWSQKEFFGGSFEEGNMDNSYYLFDFDGDKYLIMCLEFMPRDEVLEWFDYIAKKYSDYKIIVTSHNYISLEPNTVNTGKLTDGLTTYGLASLDGASANNGVEMFNKLIQNNANIIQGLNGHVGNCTYFELENIYGDLVMNASFDAWSSEINKAYAVDGIIALGKYYDDGKIGFYLYDTVESCYYATNYRWEADMSQERGVI